MPTTPSQATQSPSVHKVEPEGTTLVSYTGHSDLITALAWSPDGTMLASGGNDQSLQVWDAATGQHISTYHGHSKDIVGIAWSPDGKFIASCDSEDYSVHVWNSQTGQLTFTLKVEQGASVLAWSPDGKFIAAGSDRISIWSVASHQVVTTYKDNTGSYIRHIVWSPDGKYLAASDDEHTIQVWNAANSQAVYTYRGHKNTINALAWSPDSQRIVSASEDGTAQVWDATTGKHVFVHQVANTGVYGVRSVDWSPDGKSIASVDDEGASGIINVWNAQTGQINYSDTKDNASLLAWSPDGSRIANDHGLSDVVIWQVGPSTHTVPSPTPRITPTPITHGPGTPLASYHLAGVVKAVAWSPNGKELAAGNASGLITIWDTTTHKMVHTLMAGGGLSGLTWNHAGDHLAASAEDVVVIWNTKTYQEASCNSDNNLGTINALAWSPDGKQLALAGSEVTIDLCNIANGQTTQLYQDDNSPDLQGGFLSVSWSPDGKELAFGGSDSTLTILDVLKKKVVTSYIGATIINAVTWSPDGRYVASGGFGSATTAIHPGSSGDTAISYDGDTGATVSAIGWSPNGKYTASSTTSGLVEVGSLANQKIIFSFGSHYTPVLAVAWSPNGQAIASTDQDGNILVWQAPT